MNSNRLPAFAVLILLGCVALPGCVERELFIDSDPPGAMVFVDGVARETTPLSLPFDFYGERKIELRLADHRVHRQQIDLNPPWYMIFPLDFFSEVLIPFTFVDSHPFEIELEEIPNDAFEDQDEILERARAMREST